MKKTLRLGLLGGRGRMGARMQALIADGEVEGLELYNSVGRGEPFDGLFGAQVIIDVSSPEALERLLTEGEGQKKLPALIIGTTGIESIDPKKITSWAKKAPVLQSANFGLGIQVLSLLLQEAGPILKKFGYKPVMVETHHVHKKDKPSGTAKQLIASSGIPFADEDIFSIRAGEVVGTHEIRFYGPSDSLVFTHTAQDRTLFARGALEVAKWLAGHAQKGKTGQFTMLDYLKSVS
jgi:4-hydroxy-tetrahydrodipicolinate reductase